MLTHVGVFSVDFSRIDTGKTVCFLVSGGLWGVLFFAYFASRRVVPKYHAPSPSLTAPTTFSAIWYGCCRP